MKSEVYNEDCMVGMARYPDNYFDLSVVDPPYGISVHKQESSGRFRSNNKWKTPKIKNYKTFDDSKPPTEIYFKELFRVSKNQVIWGGNYFTEHLPVRSGWIVWNKKVDIKEKLSMCELAWTSYNIKCNMFDYLWAGFKKQKQIVRIHPTQKPVALYDWIFQNYAEPGFKILDTHLGSASSRIAAHKNKLDFVGFEIDKEYFDAAEKRYQDFISQLTLF